VADLISPKAIELLKEIPEFDIVEVADSHSPRMATEIKNCEAIIAGGKTVFQNEMLAEAGNLKLIVKTGLKSDDIDEEFAAQKGIEVRHTPFSTSIMVAEYTLAIMLGICRMVGPVYKQLKEFHWNEKCFSEGIELYGKTSGIIGFGRIGKELARRQRALGMRVVYFDILEMANDLDAQQMNLEELLGIADFISLHLPSTKETTHMISHAQLAAMKEDAVLVDVSLGDIVDEDALTAVLRDQKLKAVAMEVSEKDLELKRELISHPKVFPFPSLSVTTVEGEETVGLNAVSILKDFFNV
jgi:D-3-phosphoglycerate dehydrogenase